jgi:hypothetical protein
VDKHEGVLDGAAHEYVAQIGFEFKNFMSKAQMHY